jgi:hypothetical protein
LGRLALIVSLWNGPLPIVHAHDADVHDPALAGDVIHHLEHYHPHVLPNSHIDFGWHWHLVPPPANHSDEKGSDDGDCPYCPRGSQETQLQSSADVTLQTMGTWFVPVKVCSGFIPIPTAVSQRSTHYLDTYLDSVSLGTLLRVARC